MKNNPMTEFPYGIYGSKQEMRYAQIKDEILKSLNSGNEHAKGLVLTVTAGLPFSCKKFLEEGTCKESKLATKGLNFLAEMRRKGFAYYQEIYFKEEPNGNLFKGNIGEAEQKNEVLRVLGQRDHFSFPTGTKYKKIKGVLEKLKRAYVTVAISEMHYHSKIYESIDQDLTYIPAPADDLKGCINAIKEKESHNIFYDKEINGSKGFSAESALAIKKALIFNVFKTMRRRPNLKTLERKFGISRQTLAKWYAEYKARNSARDEDPKEILNSKVGLHDAFQTNDDEKRLMRNSKTSDDYSGVSNKRRNFEDVDVLDESEEGLREQIGTYNKTGKLVVRTKDRNRTTEILKTDSKQPLQYSKSTPSKPPKK